MSMIESLDRRLMLHNMGPTKDPKPADRNDENEPAVVVSRSGGDANLDGTVDFDDLLAIARNYNTSGKTWTQGDFDYDGTVSFDDLIPLAQAYSGSSGSLSGIGSSQFAEDWSLAQSMVGEPVADPFATMNDKGKLTIRLNGYNNARVLVEGRSTSVLLNNVSRHGEYWAQNVVTRSFKGVKSIEIIGNDGDDSISLADGLRFTTVRAGKGDDTIRGGDGESALYGGEGADEIYAGGGNDSLFGEAGNDRLNGETGDDRLDGGAGKDRLDGGKGRNKLAGGGGTDYVTMRVGKDKTDRDAKDKLKELA